LVIPNKLGAAGDNAKTVSGKIGQVGYFRSAAEAAGSFDFRLAAKAAAALITA
jgi:hypothetical protein